MTDKNKRLSELELYHQSPLEHFQEFVTRRRATLGSHASPETLARFNEAATRVETALKASLNP